MGKLTVIGLKQKLTISGTYTDGDGLVLKVDKRGGAYWLVRVQRDGKRQDIGLGSARLLSLAGAREEAAKLRKQVKIEKRDVLAERKDAAAAKVGASRVHDDKIGGSKSRRLQKYKGVGLIMLAGALGRAKVNAKSVVTMRGEGVANNAAGFKENSDAHQRTTVTGVPAVCG